MDARKIIIESKLEKLSKSKFRSSFKLSEKEISYIKKVGIENITKHTYEFINKRLKDLNDNDGKQTPMKGHPVFIAQHATATCCRSCLLKWHNIPKNRKLKDNEINFIVELIMNWIIKKLI